MFRGTDDLNRHSRNVKGIIFNYYSMQVRKIATSKHYVGLLFTISSHTHPWPKIFGCLESKIKQILYRNNLFEGNRLKALTLEQHRSSASVRKRVTELCINNDPIDFRILKGLLNEKKFPKIPFAGFPPE